MRFSLGRLVALCSLIQSTRALTPAEWRYQSIYFLLTDRFGRTDNSTTAPCDTSERLYCGGSWQGIINHLDYIQGMGFTAIWITPVTGQFYNDTGDGTSYHGYWQQDIYTVNPNYGTADDLKALSAALHARGMYLMVDVVANHMGYDGAGPTVDYSVFDPFDAASYFHPYCAITDYANQTQVEDCWLGDATVSLPDLDTTQAAVQAVWYAWVGDLVATYGIDGLRIDTVRNVQAGFWAGYQAAAGVYSVGEVFDGDAAYVCGYQDVLDGVLNYPVYYALRRAFTGAGTTAALAAMMEAVAAACADATLLGSFAENHDNARFAWYTGDLALARSVLTFVLLADGIPIVYAGEEQHYAGGADPANREATWLSGYATAAATAPLYGHIATTNAVRRWLLARTAGAGGDVDVVGDVGDVGDAADAWATSPNTPVYTDATTLAMRKGGAVTVLSTLGADADAYTLPLANTSFAAGAALVELYTCAALVVDADGRVPLPMASGAPRVLVPAAWVDADVDAPCGAAAATTSAAAASTAASSPASTTCAPAASLDVRFNALAATAYGDTIYLVGSLAALGSWAPAAAVALAATSYSAANPLWFVTVALPVGAAFEYKFIRKTAAGSVVWESDPNRAYAVPSGCAGATVVVTDTWR